MKKRGWKPGLTQTGFKLEKTFYPEEGAAPVETKVIAGEDYLVVRKSQTSPGITRVVQIN